MCRTLGCELSLLLALGGAMVPLLPTYKSEMSKFLFFTSYVHSGARDSGAK
jgi:hypothetical protein